MRDHEQQPVFIAPMLLTPGAVPSGEAWALEVKWDGCRAQLRYDGSVALRTRHGRECSADFPELAEIASALGKHRVTLDGELVCLRSDGRPDFARLRRRPKAGPLKCVFVGSYDLRALTRLGLRTAPRRAE